jgi:hypothetical protein
VNKFVVPLLGETMGGELKEIGEAVISLRDSCLLIDRVTFKGWSSEQLGLHLELMMTPENMALKVVVLADHAFEQEENEKHE